VRNPQGQGSRLRAELVAAADDILARTGDVEGLSLRAVARAVGIATPSIYLHFPDKRALVQAVLAVRFAQLEAAVRTAVNEPDAPGQLRAGCLAYCRFATEHPHAYRVLFGRVPASTLPAGAAVDTGAITRGDDGASPAVPNLLSSRQRETGAGGRAIPPWDGEGSDRCPRPEDAGSDGAPQPAAGAAAFGFLVDCVRRCIDEGAATPADPSRVAVNVWTALHGLVSLRSSLPTFPWPPLAQQVDDVLSGMVGLRHNLTAEPG
jgi:AcrR family transcriptional regulator